MKKKAISLLMVMILGLIVNINYVKAITINGEEWDEQKKCVYNGKNGKAGDYSDITIYYKDDGSTILTDTEHDGYYISNDENILYKGSYFHYILQNNIKIDSNGCPSYLYKWSKCNFGGECTQLTYIYSSKSKTFWQFLLTQYTFVRVTEVDEMPSVDNTTVYNCEGVISSKVKEIINKYLGYVHIIVPIMVLALGIFDFFKAMIASKEEEMKKAQNRFIVRLVAGVLVFLAPTIVNIIITILNTGACLID